MHGAMWLATKLGFFSIVQKVPPDDGDAAVYHVRAMVRADLENLLQVTGIQSGILEPLSPSERFHIMATQREVFEILSALAETIDYDHFEDPVAAMSDQRARQERASDSGEAGVSSS